MQIREMTAVFGKLKGETLRLEPGLNIIHAPNESGKSTWCHFLRTMLYGLATRERGLLADKNRFAPWDGAAMGGQLQLESRGREITVRRHTQRATAPMGECSCTYTGTADPVPGLTGLNVGEELLGVGRDVFVRSAFIGQSGLTLDQDAELERRIAALVTSGEEEISFSQVYDRLKKQLNRRRHNKTGLLPALEQEITAIRAALEDLQSLHAQEESARALAGQYERQARELEERLHQWEQIEKQAALQEYLRAQSAAETAEAYAQTMAQATAKLPPAGELGRLQGTAEAIDKMLEAAERAALEAKAGEEAEAAALARLEKHAFYGDSEEQLQARGDALAAKERKFSPIATVLSVVWLAAVGAGVYFALPLGAAVVAGIGGGGAVAMLIALLIYNSIRKKRNQEAAEDAAMRRQGFEAELESYRKLQSDYEAAQKNTRDRTAAAKELRQRCREGLLQLLSLVQPFAPEAVSLTNVRGALEQAVLRRHKADRAAQEAREARLHCQMLQRHLPAPPLPEADALLPRPPVSRAQIQESLPRAMAGAQSARSQLDSLTGQLRSMGDRDTLESRLRQKEEQHRALQAEYDAIAMAMEALQSADQTLQNRFSPELGRRAAEIFSCLTGGKYHQVLFDRSFALSASPTGDTVNRDIRLLSQGAADQLYLATRLAICQMVLPQEDKAPLILDDALANFDEERMRSALDYLVEESATRQILLFTCHTRESAYLQGRQGVHHIAL